MTDPQSREEAESYPIGESLEQTPAALGYRMPAEWHPHEATWLVWPKNKTTWPDRLDQVREIYLEWIRSVAPFERIHLIVDDQENEDAVRRRISQNRVDLQRIRFFQVTTVDSWIRDYGPNFLLRKTGDGVERAWNHWQFNAWGNKYEDLKRDALVGLQLAEYLDPVCFRPDFVLEGGSIDVNGKGVCLTTEQCLLHANRNSTRSRQDIETILSAYLGLTQIIWLGEGIAGDDTDGHIDDIARFVNGNTIVYALEDDPADPNFAPLRDNFRRLQEARDTDGEPFRLVPLPMPDPVEGAEGRLPASYANFYVANQVVLVPIFGQRKDSRALEQLRSLFPDRRVIGSFCEPLVWGMGTIHCLTQQQPAAKEG